MIECVPAARLDSVIDVWHLVVSVTVPRQVLPSLNVTEPPGVAVVPTGAVNETEIVTGVPAIGWALLAYGVDSLGVTLLATDRDRAAEVAALKWASPPYVAVIECVPPARLETLS